MYEMVMINNQKKDIHIYIHIHIHIHIHIYIQHLLLVEFTL